MNQVLLRSLRACHVQRWHTVHATKYQSVAEHQYNVWLIATAIYDELFPKPHNSDERALVAQMALTHDLPEVFLGDRPTSAKPLISSTERHVFDAVHNRVARVHFGYSHEAHHGTVAEAVVKLADITEALWFARAFIPDKSIATSLKLVLIEKKLELEQELPQVSWHRLIEGLITDVVGPS